MNYEAPTITELGSVAEFTRGDKPAWKFDGMSVSDNIFQRGPKGQQPGGHPGKGGPFGGGGPYGTS